ncbi:APC family permease [Rhodococcus wratislaviensis]|nr:APC family permease [Rhodococcus wratislaviensis]
MQEPQAASTLPSSGAEGATAPTQPTRLTGNLGTTPLVLGVMAFSAPIVTIAGYMAFAIDFAGELAPLVYLITTALVLIFAVGFTTMTRRVPRPGAFYAYITVGIGRAFGLGSAFVASLSYTLLLIGLYCFAGVTIAEMITLFHGPETEWWIWTLAAWAIVSALGHFHVEVSAKVLSIVMAFEILLVVVFNVASLGQGGVDGLSVQPFNPSGLGGAGTGIFVALLFTFGNFVGFESTALYRDEVREPVKTIPRATYLAVIFIGIFYSVSCYALISAYGPSSQQVAQDNPAGMFNDALDTFVASNVSMIAAALVATSSIAALISTHNVASRYIFNLAADHAVPRYLAGVHPKHHSPYRASLTIAVIAVIALVTIAGLPVNTAVVYGAMSGLGSMGVMTLMVLVSIAVIAWFARPQNRGIDSVWKTVIAPIISVLAIGTIVVFAMSRFDLVVGGEPGQLTWLLVVPATALAIGIGIALYFRSAKPEYYDNLGRAERGDEDAAGGMKLQV